MTPQEYEWADEKISERIAAIDKMFEEATGWGSWMSEASSERRGLVRQLRAMGIQAEDKYILRAEDGTISD